MFKNILLLAASGALGTLSRAGLMWSTTRLVGRNFPWGTLAVNILGSFFAGLAVELFESKVFESHQVRFIVLVGFMGAFTTFSTYMIDTAEIAREGYMLKAGANVLAQNVLGIAALLFGVYLGRLYTS